MKKNYFKLFMLIGLLGISLNSFAQLNEGFEGGSTSFPPAGWISYRGANGLGIIEDWAISSNAHSGSQAAFVRYESFTPNDSLAQDWLVTNGVQVTSNASLLSFWEREGLETNYNTIYSIRVSTTSATNIASFTNILSYGEDTTANFNKYRQRIINLSNYVGSTVYIAFVMEQNDGDSWYIDDVVLAGQCQVTPVAPILNTVTTNSATINVALPGGTTSYQYSLVAGGANPNATMGAVSSATSLSINSLIPSTSYSLYVRAICGAGDTSAWSMSLNFTTQCVAITSLPWQEGFESLLTVGDSILPACWTENGDWTSTDTTGSYYRKARTGTKYIYTKWDADDDILTPSFLLNNTGNINSYDFKFWYAADNRVWDTIAVYAMNVFTGAKTMLGTLLSFKDTNYVEFTGTLQTPDYGEYVFGIHVNASYTPWYLRFDDFSLTENNSVGIAKMSKTTFSVYPNPSKGLFTIASPITNATAVVYNLMGELVVSKTLNAGQNTIDLTSIAKGLYVLRINDGANLVEQKLIVE